MTHIVILPVSKNNVSDLQIPLRPLSLTLYFKSRVNMGRNSVRVRCDSVRKFDFRNNHLYSIQAQDPWQKLYLLMKLCVYKSVLERAQLLVKMWRICLNASSLYDTQDREIVVNCFWKILRYFILYI